MNLTKEQVHSVVIVVLAVLAAWIKRIPYFGAALSTALLGLDTWATDRVWELLQRFGDKVPATSQAAMAAAEPQVMGSPPPNV